MRGRHSFSDIFSPCERHGSKVPKTDTAPKNPSSNLPLLAHSCNSSLGACTSTQSGRSQLSRRALECRAEGQWACGSEDKVDALRLVSTDLRLLHLLCFLGRCMYLFRLATSLSKQQSTYAEVGEHDASHVASYRTCKHVTLTRPSVKTSRMSFLPRKGGSATTPSGSIS